MDINLLNVIIAIFKNTVVTDNIGNHISTWIPTTLVMQPLVVKQEKKKPTLGLS